MQMNTNSAAAQMEDMDGMKHMDGKGDMPHSKDHAALDKLIDSASPTHRAVKNGAWSDASTWAGGKIPGNGAKVLIGDGLTVTYDQVSEDRLQTIAIKGNLKFATNQDTQLYVETILNSEDGKLDIGSQQQSVANGKSARIIFTSDRAVNRAWDPTQLSKGLVSHGEVNIYGARKSEKAALKGNATAGNNVLTFKGDLSGWAVGDQIVLGGTGRTYKGKDTDNSRLQDEVLTITEINGNNVRFTNNDIKTGDNTVLRYDHTVSTYADAGELDLYVANLTRNVSFETENGKDVPIDRRAHVMLMHNPNVNVFNAGFYDLGRSDKTKIVDDIGQNVDGSKGNGTNIRGRYALHLHKTGVGKGTAILRGNAVSGSPGWGIVQHESSAGLEDNVVFDVAGAGIVAESGNETGWWTDNLVMKSTGVDWRTGQDQRKNREKKFDLGFQGDGYWIQGAGLIKNKDNKAISSNRTGMVVFGSALDLNEVHRPIETIQVSDLPSEIQKLLPADQTEIDIRDVPMADIVGFEAYNGTNGLRIWAKGTNFDGENEFSNKGGEDALETAHLGRSKVKDFKIWHNSWGGAEVLYSSNVTLEDGLILAKDDKWGGGGSGLFNNHAAFNSTFDNLTIKGYQKGAQLEYPNTNKDFIAPTLKNSTFSDNVYNLDEVGDEADMEGRPDDFGLFTKLENNQFAEAEGSNATPTARFSAQALGGLSVELDASASSDSDPLLPGDGSPRPLDSKGIAAYAWDLDNDGKNDAYGRTLKQTFDRAGSRKVGLTVFDAQGKANKTAQTVNVQPTAYGNAFMNGNFDSSETLESWQSYSQWSDMGWYKSPDAQTNGGMAKLSKPGKWSGFVGQVVRDQSIHRGDQTLSFKLKNVEGDPSKDWKKNEVSVELWGVNGAFDHTAWEDEGPTKVGAMPMQRTQLVDDMFGGETGKDSEFFDWKTLSYDVDLGKGYDYLLFQVKGSRMADSGDYVAVDNVSLNGPANSIPGQINPPNTINPTPSFAPSSPDKPTPPPVTEPDTEEPDTENPDTPGSTPDKPTGKDPQSLVTQLSFEEGEGRVSKDTAPGSVENNAKFTRGAEWGEGKFGGAVALNGERGMALVSGASENQDNKLVQETLSMWFKADSTGGKDQQVLFERGSKRAGLNAYIENDQLLIGGWNNRKREQVSAWARSDNVKSGQWHHLAVAIEGQADSAESTLTAYLDGMKIDQAESLDLVHRSRISLGNTSGSTLFESGSGTHKSSGLAGAIDEVKIFNEALSDSQIKGLSAA